MNKAKQNETSPFSQCAVCARVRDARTRFLFRVTICRASDCIRWNANTFSQQANARLMHCAHFFVVRFFFLLHHFINLVKPLIDECIIFSLNHANKTNKNAEEKSLLLQQIFFLSFLLHLQQSIGKNSSFDRI